MLGAVFLFTVGIIGVALGPILPALLTDHLFRSEAALGAALALASAIVLPVTCVLLRLGSSRADALAAVERQRRAPIGDRP